MGDPQDDHDDRGSCAFFATGWSQPLTESNGRLNCVHGYERKLLPVSASEPPPCPGGERVTALTAARGFLEHFDRDIGSGEISPRETNMTNAQHVRMPNSFAYDISPENRLNDVEFYLRPSDRTGERPPGGTSNFAFPR